MRLRNKKTGVIVECESIVFAHCNAFALDWAQYEPNAKSLAGLNEEWEDYKPKEPLIKDERIRKAVRAWWDALDKRYMRSTKILYQDKRFYVGIYVIDCGGYAELENIKDGDYTIAELCGKEEE